jgi:dTDP-4-dehydrorhamnose reductase
LIFTNREEVDLARPETLHGFFDTNPFSGIINCAAYTQVDQAEEESEKALQINAEGVQNLVNFAEEKKLSWFIFLRIMFLMERLLFLIKKRINVIRSTPMANPNTKGNNEWLRQSASIPPFGFRGCLVRLEPILSKPFCE